MDIVIRDEVRQWMQLQMNGKVAYYTDAPDVEDALSLLDIDPKPENVLEVGSGIGRASVYLNKRLGWNETTFWLLDGDSTGKKKQVQTARLHLKENVGDHVYNSVDAAETFCGDNGLGNRCGLIDIARWDCCCGRGDPAG